MKKLEKDIDVVCVFYHGKVPEPRKFKIKYKNGTVKTVDVDIIRRSEILKPNNLTNLDKVLYVCQSEIEEILIQYELMYYVKDMRWELYSVAQ